MPSLNRTRLTGDLATGRRGKQWLAQMEALHIFEIEQLKPDERPQFGGDAGVASAVIAIEPDLRIEDHRAIRVL